ncbi:MAG TPA: ABC transporter substrate-binding protein, partial [Nannocystis sp.]
MTSLSHLLIRVSACAALGGVLGACSSILDFTECETNEDCASFFVNNKPMHCVDHVCKENEAGCKSHSECAGLGPSYICTATNECASTESPQCGAPIWPGGEMTDGVALVGVLVPKDGPDRELGLAMEKAALTAVKEFNASGALQNGGKIAPVVCDTRGDKTGAIAAA